jgi:phosphatidylglycerophosphate synthase
MLEQSVRNKYQTLFVEPILSFIPLTITPVHLTILSAIVGIFFIPALLFCSPFMAITILLFSGYLDTLDGSLARVRNQTSDFGSILDIMADRIVECAVMAAFFLRSPNDAGSVIAMIIASLLCITSFLVVGIFEKNQSNKSFHYSPGLIERAEAFIFFIVMILLPNYFAMLAICYSALVLWTAIVRIKQFSKFVN